MFQLLYKLLNTLQYSGTMKKISALHPLIDDLDNIIQLK